MQSQPKSVTELVAKHRTNGLLIDTNLLLLLVIGTFKRDLIGKHKRTHTFGQDDFQKLGHIKSQFSKLLTTPNILTETDNLGRQMSKDYWLGFATTLANLTLELIETHVQSNSVVQSKYFAKLGLSDSASVQLGHPMLIVTDDFALYGIALSAGLDAINLNHLRYNWHG